MLFFLIVLFLMVLYKVIGMEFVEVLSYSAMLLIILFLFKLNFCVVLFMICWLVWCKINLLMFLVVMLVVVSDLFIVIGIVRTANLKTF